MPLPSDHITDQSRPEREPPQSETVEAAEEAKQHGRRQAEEGREKMAREAEKLAGTADKVSADLRGDLPSLADYTAELAGSIREMANQLRHRSIDELLADTQNLARRNPALFLFGSVAVGFALSRFFKASMEPGSRNFSDQAGQAQGAESGLMEGTEPRGQASIWPRESDPA